MPTSDDTPTIQKPKVLIPEVKLQARVQEIAAEINHDYHGRPVVGICILKGSFIFFSDVIRHLDMPVTCEFLGVSSYGNRMVSSGEVKVTLDINEPLEGKHVIIFEDIVDSGLTLRYLMDMLRSRKPASLKTCSLLIKPDALQADIQVDYLGFKIGKEFVVGYGLDHGGKYRGLPYIGYIEQEH